MITQADVMMTLQEADPATTQEQAQHLHDRMIEDLSDREDQISHLLRERWTANNGRQPDGLTWGRILDQAKMDAENQIRQEYLAPLTEQIVQNQLDDPEDNPVLAALDDPNGWRTNPEDIPVRDETDYLVDQIWGNETLRFRMLAGALLERMSWMGQPMPTSPKHPDYEPALRQIQDAMKDREERDRRIAQRRQK